jgi:transposase
MDILHSCCAGLDVHKRDVVACRLTLDEHGRKVSLKRRFTTMTPDLLALSDWLIAGGVTHVAMESTGEYWRPIYNILEGHFAPECLLVVNSKHVKNVPGRKTDMKDAEWIAELLQHGLLRPSFVPPAEQRDLRDLTRHRTNFVRERATLVNRVQKVLEGANIKLASVATDVMGVSGRSMLDAIVAGTVDPSVLALLAKGRLKEKREQLEQALTGRVRPHQRLILSELLCQIDSLEESIARMDQAIDEALRPFDASGELVGLLDTIPGVATTTAQVIISEVGTDLSRFPTAGHLCVWAGVAPGNNESAGKRLSGKTPHGNRALCSALVQAAHAACRTKDTYLGAQFRRLVGRRGKNRALVAVAHSILVIVYHIIQRREAYKDLGSDYFDRRKPEATAKRLIGRLVQLGYTVTPPTHVNAA